MTHNNTSTKITCPYGNKKKKNSNKILKFEKPYFPRGVFSVVVGKDIFYRENYPRGRFREGDIFWGGIFRRGYRQEVKHRHHLFTKPWDHGKRPETFNSALAQQAYDNSNYFFYLITPSLLPLLKVSCKFPE